MSQFTIYSSSAGSGKTFTLAKEYLKLALMDDPAVGAFRPGYFRHILAVTFTNDAAREMKERILSYLRAFTVFDELSDSEKAKFAGVRRLVLDELNAERAKKAAREQTEVELLDDTELTRRARLVFHRMLHQYADVAVGTIDSFVQRVATAFADQLDLPANFEVSLDQDTLLDAAVQNLLAKAGHEDWAELTEALHDFAEEKARNGGNFNRLADDLTRFAAVLLQEHRHETLERLAELRPADFAELRRRLVAHNEALETQQLAVAGRAVELLDAHALYPPDFAYGNTGIYGFFQKWALPEGRWKVEVLPKNVAKTLENDAWFGAKTPAPTKQTIERLKGELRECAEALVAVHEQHREKYLLFSRIIEYVQELTLLGYLRDELRQLQQETGRIHLSNFGKAILNVVLREPMPFVYERLGERYHHILIDEFQDTSTVQWTNFLPLVGNALGSGYFCLAVGDGKQAIYAWRGGEMQQIVHLYACRTDDLFRTERGERAEILREHYDPLRRGLKPEQLKTNYRSRREIVAFNNDFFRVLVEKRGAEFPLLGQVYETAFQESPVNMTGGGHVQVDFLPLDDDTDDAMPHYVLTLLGEVQRAGYDLRDVAILCRKNAHSKQIAGFLKERGFAILSSDSLLLKFSEPVNFVFAVLRALHAPEQSLPRYETLLLFYRLILRQEPDEATAAAIQKTVLDRDPQAVFKHLSARGYYLDPFRLQQTGLYELVEKIIVTFRLFERSPDTAYLFRLLDLALEFSTRQSAHLSDFLRFWEEKKDALSIQTPAGGEAITVTSVHKSKGLEYPVVIVPYADWATGSRWQDLLWGELDDVDYAEFKFSDEETGAVRQLRTAQVKRAKDLASTALAEQYQREEEKTFIENVNMLYVALTRPTDRLYLVASLDKKGEAKKGTVAELLHDYLDATNQWHDGQLSYCLTCGNPKPPTNHEPRGGPQRATNNLTIGTVISHDRTSRVRLRRLAEKLFDLEGAETSRERANKLRAALAKVKTPADVPGALDALVREGWLTPAETPDLRGSLDALLGLPHLAPLFAPGLRVDAEREILQKGSDPLRPDRVTRLPDGRLVVVDFKPGTRREADAKTLRKCVDVYRQMGHPRVEGLLVYLGTGEVVEVG